MKTFTDLTEKQLDRTERYSGPLYQVYSDRVLLPNGHTSVREVIEHVDGVAVLPLDENNNVLTVTQYRYVFGKPLLEIPAGKLDPGEDPYTGGLRELREETGATTDKLLPLGEIYPTPGYCNEIIRLYLARDLSWGEMDPDEDEFLSVERIPFSVMLERVLSGEITDAKTAIAVMKAKLLLEL